MFRLGMFFTNFDNLIPGLLNLWRAVRRLLFSEETLLKLLISKAVTVVVMSVTKKCIFVSFVCVPLGYVHINRHCQSKDVEFGVTRFNLRVCVTL